MTDFFAALQQIHVKIRNAARAYLSFLDQLHHRGPGIFHGRAGFVRPMELVEINSVHTQTAKGGFAFAPYGIWLQSSLRLSHGIAFESHAALSESKWTLRLRNIAQKPSDHFLRMAEPINRGRINPVDAQIDRVAHRGDGLGVVLVPPAVGPAASADCPGTEPNCGDFQSTR